MTRQLLEFDEKTYVTDREKQLKKQLIKLLRDNHHAKYAERLKDFDVNIVPLSGPGGDPTFTAATSFNDGIIYVGEGFLTDPGTFSQLDVIIRHELAHNLLMHQIRMMHQIGDEIWEGHHKYSIPFNELCNILMDFEISNKKYSAKDKDIVRKTIINGQIISGLITEDHRHWLTLSLEQMYKKSLEELSKINNLINLGSSPNSAVAAAYSDNQDAVDKGNLEHNYNQSVDYKMQGITGCELLTKLDDFITSNVFKNLPPNLKSLAISLQDTMHKDPSIKGNNKVKDFIKQIKYSAPYEPVTLLYRNKPICTLYTPDEKSFCIELLKLILIYEQSDSAMWYDKIMQVLGKNLAKNLTVDDLIQIKDSLAY